MSEVIVCAEPGTEQEAARFVEELGGRPRAYSMRSLRLPRKTPRVLVYLKGRKSSRALKSCLSQMAKDKNLNVIVYSDETGGEDQAAELGMVVGECRPKRTHIFFEAAAVGKFFRLRPSNTGGNALEVKESPDAISSLRKSLQLTQVEFAKSVGVSERTVQKWETGASVPAERQLRDLRELADLLARYVKKDQLSIWLKSANGAFQSQSPHELILDGKTRDIILEFRRMQTGEPL